MAAHNDHTSGEFHIGPLETERFAPAKAAGRHDLEQDPEPVAGDVVKERAQLGGLPRVHLWP
ncbi:MAG: hypothetical protein M3510_10320 [Actinomycetota bacterium]|nr:hypothetical protein [Actinomycetota bacterium]